MGNSKSRGKEVAEPEDPNQITFVFKEWEGDEKDSIVKLPCIKEGEGTLLDLWKQVCQAKGIDEDSYSLFNQYGKPKPLNSPVHLPESIVIESTILPTYYYDGKEWTKDTKKSQTHLNITPIDKIQKLKIVTFNVWFDGHQQETRFKSLMNLMKELDPDVIALQEMTKITVEMISKEPFFQNNFIMSDNSSVSSFGASWYGNLLLINKRILGALEQFQFNFYSFPSKYGRRLIYFTAKDWIISTAHFDSGNNNQFRVEQLKITKDILMQYQNAFLMGDFNWVDGIERDKVLAEVYTPSKFHDIGGEFNIGNTFDKKIVTMKSLADQKTPKPPSDFDNFGERIDLIMVREGDWVCNEVKRLGVDPIQKELWISDHFGVCAELTLQQ